MSTSLLYHALGVRGYRYVKSDYRESQVLFTVEPNEESLCCTACGSAEVIRKGHVDRTFSALPIGSRQVILQAHIYRLECKVCDVLRQAAKGTRWNETAFATVNSDSR